MDSAYFSASYWRLKEVFPKNFFVFQNLDALYRPVAGKPFVLEDLCWNMSISVASALSAETIFEIMKCMSHVDMPARVRMGSKSVILRFFNSGDAHDINISIFRRRAFLRTRNTFVKPNYASVKTNEDRHILSAVQIFGKHSSFWQYKVCADIRSSSLERRR